ncbi:MAG: GntR family transcriptional regulator [Gemmatimonadales bacterium]
MFESIDPRSPTPLYEQIAARIRVAIAAGEFQPGDSLPSVRSLSQTLRVNPATVAQAYRDLENEGFVAKRHGSGTFVKEVAEFQKDEERMEQAGSLVRRMLQDAARLGIDPSELANAFTQEVGVEINE